MRVNSTASRVARAGAVAGLLASAVAVTLTPLASAAGRTSCDNLLTPVHQVVSPSTARNLITISAQEAEAAEAEGYTDRRGVVFTASAIPDPALVTVHTVTHPGTGDLDWVPAGRELTRALVAGYVDGGIAFHAAAKPGSGCTPIGRYVKGGVHRIAVGQDAQRNLTEDGWVPAGKRFYAKAPAPDTTFTLAAIPDTQQEVLNATDSRFRNRTEWLADHKLELDLRFAAHIGDVTNWGWLDQPQFDIASDAMLPLEQAGIPYALTIGNHDTAAVGVGGSAYDPPRTKELVRDTTAFNATFTAERQTSVRGAFEPGKLDNVWSTFNAGGKRWLVLTLELWPRTEAIDWARTVVADHPGHNVIVQTHSYLTGDGSIYGKADYGANSPQYLYDNLIKLYPNIKIVLSGHTGQAATRTDVGVHGNVIHSFLQCFHSNTTNPVRLLEIDTDAGTIKTRVYGPHTGETFPQYQQTISDIDWIG